MRLALATSSLLLFETFPAALASEQKTVSALGESGPIKEKVVKKRRYGKYRAANLQTNNNNKKHTFQGEKDRPRLSAKRLANSRRNILVDKNAPQVDAKGSKVDQELMNGILKHSMNQLHHRECVPTGTADVGLLSSCESNEYCMESQNSSMGGYCMEQPTEHNRKLQASMLIPTSVCDPSNAYYWGYYESCDCGRFDLDRDVGSFVCTYVEHYCFYEGICGLTSASMRKLADGSASSSFCYTIQTPLEMLACYAYRVDPQPSCSIVVDGTTCSSCRLDFDTVDPYYDSPYACFEFDCRNTMADVAGNSCTGGYLLDGIVTTIFYQQLETIEPAPTKRPTKLPTLEPTPAPTTKAPTKEPTKAPTKAPVPEPTKRPTKSPSSKPSEVQTEVPTETVETEVPSSGPSIFTTFEPTLSPTNATLAPSELLSLNAPSNSTANITKATTTNATEEPGGLLTSPMEPENPPDDLSEAKAEKSGSFDVKASLSLSLLFVMIPLLAFTVNC